MDANEREATDRVSAEEYQRLAPRTETKRWPVTGLPHTTLDRFEHGAIGLAGEAGELLDALKRHKFYGLELDRVNVLEEVGDVLWYAVLVCDSMGFTLEEAMGANLRKLQARFPDCFTAERAELRDLAAERAALGQ